MSVLRKFALALVMFCFAVAGVATPAAAIVRPSDAAAMHRLYNPNSGEHFYTASVYERDAVVAAGWSYEGIGWYAPKNEGADVYRLYNANAGDHHYTLSAGERDALVGVGWNFEGVGWLSDANEEVPVWRQYNPNALAGAHNFSTSKSEHLSLCMLGWRGEGIAWYGVVPEEVPVRDIVADISGVTLPRGTVFDASPHIHITPEDHNDDITWSSADPAVATVDNMGRVTAVGEGETTVVVRSSSGKEATIHVYVPREGSAVASGPDEGAPAHWASVWSCHGVITSSRARELMGEGDGSSRRLYGPEVLNVRASVDGRGLALDSDRLEDSLTEGQIAAISAGTQGTYSLTLSARSEADVRASFDTTVTVVPDGTVIARDNDDDPRHSAAIFAHKPAEAYRTRDELGRDRLLEDMGARLWVDGEERSDLSVLSLDDGGIAATSAEGGVGFFEVALSYGDDNVSAQAKVWADLDGEATIRMVAASSTAGVAGGTVEPVVTHLPSRLATDAEFSATVTSAQLGYTFEGWYEGEVASGSRPTGRMVSSEQTFRPTVESGYWPAEGVYTAYFRANTDTPYSVTRYVQKLNAAGTDVMGTEHNLDNFERYVDEDDDASWEGTTGELTSADVGGIEGFVVTPFEQKTIAGDGSTNIEVYYERESLTPALLPNGKSATVPQANPTVYGALVPNPGNPSAVAGYDFTAWSQDESGADVFAFGSDTMPADGLTLYADWRPKQFVANLDDNGGTGGQQTCDLVYGERPQNVAVPTREHFVFCGYWAGVVEGDAELDVQYVARDGSWLQDFTGDENLYLTALWATDGTTPYTVNHWTQRLNAEGADVAGSERTPDNYELVASDTQTLRGDAGSMTAAEFKSYEGFRGRAFAQVPIAEDGSSVVDIYYDRIPYALDLQANGHGTAPSARTVPYGARIVDPGPPAEVTGFVFSGWCLDREDGEPVDFATLSMPVGGLALWAKWDAAAITRWETIGQMMEEGTKPVHDGAEVTLPEKPTYQAGSWHVSGPEQLAWVCYAANHGLLPAGTTTDVMLTGDCDMTGEAYGGTSDEPLLWTPMAGFAGTFDGDGRTISRLRVSEDGAAALIATTTGPTTIKDLAASDWTVESAAADAAALVAHAGGDLEVTGVTATNLGVFGAGSVGGLVADAAGIACRISDANLKSVTASGARAGGLVGHTSEGCALECDGCALLDCEIDAEAAPCGGVCGHAQGRVDLRLVGVQQGVVSAFGSCEDGHGRVGGLIGHAEAPVTIDNAYATCEINATDDAAGLVLADDGVRVDVAHAYFAGAVTDFATSWAIASGDARYDVCYYDADLLPTCMDASDEGLTACTTEQMCRPSTAFYLNGSAFGSPWTQVNAQNAGYPVFGKLSDGSPYTVRLDCVRSNAGEAGTDSQRVWYGRLAEKIVPPQLDGYTFEGYYSDYGGRGTRYIDENGDWLVPWDRPEGATLHANWKGNTIDYVFPYSWAKSLPQKTLFDQGWTFYNTDEAKALPSEAEVGVTPGARLVGWRIDNEGEVLTELPAGHKGGVRLYAYYVMGPAQTWGQTYFPMRDRIDGYPELPTYDTASGRWNVSTNLELAYVVGAVNNGQIPRGRTTNMLMTADVDLTGSETYASSQGEVTLGGSAGNPLLWTPCNNYSGEFSGLGADAAGQEVVHRLTTLKISNVFSSTSGGVRHGEGYYSTGNATGVFKRLVNANVHDLIIQEPNVYAQNTKKAGRTTFSTTATLAGIAEGSTRINRVGIEGGSVYIDHRKSVHNERVAGMVGTLRGRASMEDVYVRGTNVSTHATNHNWRYQSSTAAGICVASQAGARVSNAYFQGVARAVTSNVRQNRCGAVLATTALSGKSIYDSGATVENCFVDTSSSFKGSCVDGACARVAPADLKNKTQAYVLNGSELFADWSTTPWSRDTAAEGAANAGYPTFGRLLDESPYTITLDSAGADAGLEGTRQQEVYFLQRPSNIEVPKRSGYVFAGYWSGAGGTGKMYVDSFGAWVDDWRELEPRVLHVKWVKIDNWGSVGKAVYDADSSIGAGDPPAFDAEAGGWQVTTPEQLAYVAYINTNNKIPEGTGRTFAICADLDMQGLRWGASETQALAWVPMGNFSGAIEGNDHVISHLRMPSGKKIGFIGITGGVTTMSNLTFADSSASGADRVAIVVGLFTASTTFTNVHVRNSTVYGSSDGVGAMSGGTMSGGAYCFYQCSVQGGSVRGAAQNYTGGFFGTLYSRHKPYFVAENCFITASVDGPRKGGFLGTQHADGRMYNAGYTKVSNSYNAGPINGNIITPLGSVSNCFYDNSKCFGSTNGAGGRSTEVMKSKVMAFKLNGNKLGGPWTQDDSINDGYPYYGELTDYPKLTATLDNGEGATPATSTVEVPYTQVPDRLTELPTKEHAEFDGYYSAPGGGGDCYVDATGTWQRPWNFESDTKLYAKWAPLATYTVRHWQQKVNADATAVAGTDRTVTEPVAEGEPPTCTDYALALSQTLEGRVGGQTSAEAQDYPGFVAPTITQTEVLSDGSVTLDVFYDRATYTLTLDDQGGSGGQGTATLTYGVRPPSTYSVPVRASVDPLLSYEFAGYHAAPGREGDQLIGPTGAVVSGSVLAVPWTSTQPLVVYAGWIEHRTEP